MTSQILGDRQSRDLGDPRILHYAQYNFNIV